MMVKIANSNLFMTLQFYGLESWNALIQWRIHWTFTSPARMTEWYQAKYETLNSLRLNYENFDEMIYNEQINS